MTDPDRDFEKALDRLTPPAPRAGLIDDIVSAAAGRTSAPAQAWERAPRDRRGGWLRGHRVFVATMAATIMSATAAAAAGGWLGEAGTRLPVIAQIARVMPEAAKAPDQRKARTGTVALANKSPSTKTSEDQTSASVVPVPPRAKQAVDRIEARLDRRDARRAAKGLPANTEKERALLDKFKAAETRGERKEVLREARALRQERRADRQALPLCTPEQSADPAANGCRRKMSPERRAEIMQKLCARMAENGRTPPRCRPDVQGGPEPYDPTPQ